MELNPIIDFEKERKLKGLEARMFGLQANEYLSSPASGLSDLQAIFNLIYVLATGNKIAVSKVFHENC